MHVARALGLAVAVSAVTPSAADEADEADEITDDGGARPQRITARLDGATARFTLRFVVSTTGPDYHESRLAVSVPERGVVTATKVDGRALAVTPADEAAKAMQSLVEKTGPHRPWAVHVSRPQSAQVTIGIASPRASVLTIDLDVSAPTCFLRDRRYVDVPASWQRALPAAQRVTEAQAKTVAEACAPPHRVGDELYAAFDSRELARRPVGPQRIGAVAGRVALGTTHVAKVELDLAGRLSELPRDLVTVILVDTSRSMSDAQLEAQREIVAAYLRATPHGTVQVIAFARAARPLLPGWSATVHATPRIERELRALTRHNGSNVDVALDEAARWLARIQGTRRVVLFTDERLAERLHQAVALSSRVSSDTLVHVVTLDERGLDWQRDDDAVLAPLAAATRGYSVRTAGATEDARRRGTPLDATLLARPITFDRPVVSARGWATLETGVTCATHDDDAQPLAEGSSCVWWGQTTGLTGPIAIEGYLWGQRVSRPVQPDAGRAVEVARELTTTSQLDAHLQALADRAARAVNSVWSLFDTWGGDGGYGDLELSVGASRGSMWSGGHPTPIGTSGGIGTGPPPDVSAILRGVVAACRPAQPTDVTVETTLEEIVDVRVDGGGAARSCIEDRLWDTHVAIPHARPHQITSFRLGPT